MRKSKTQIKLSCALIVVAGVLAPAARGVDRFWTNSVGGNFNAAANWFGNSAPGAADNANFTNNASYKVSWIASATNANAFFNADSGTVTQAIAGVTWLVTNSYVIGRDSSSTATVTHISGELRITNAAMTARFMIGQGSRGTYNLSGGNVLADSTSLGNSSLSASNHLIVTGSVLSNSISLIVGEFGRANLLSITNAGLVTAGFATIGSSDSSSNNVLIVGGANSELRLRNTNGFDEFIIGANSSGNRLIITNGGRVTSYFAYLSDDVASTNNSVVVAGAGSIWTNTTSIDIGYRGPGNRLDILGGGQIWAGEMYVGEFGDSSNNMVVVSGTGSALTLASDSGIGNLEIGGGSRGNSLLVTNGGAIVSDWGSVGTFDDGNTAVITGSNSVWSLPGASLFQIGQDGSSNRLSVLAGARVENSGILRMGYSPGMNGNLLFVSGAGTTYSNGSSVSVGTGGSGNQIVVSNGATLIASSAQLGLNTNANGNMAIVTGSGAVWTNASGFIVGTVGVSNSLVVSNGGAVFCSSGTIGSSANSTRNVAIVTGAGSVWTNLGGLTVGNGGGLNQLFISNAGMVFNSGGTIGSSSSANGNLVVIAGAGSVWSNRNSLTVGSSGSVNQLVISNGGVVLSPALTMGAFGTSSNNICVVAGGTLYVTNASGTAKLDIRRGTIELDSGFVLADVLVLTNIAGAVDLNGGLFVVRGSTVANGQPFYVGDGASSAHFGLGGNGTFTFANGLIVHSNARVFGDGTVTGPVTVESGGVLEVDGTGKIMLSSSPLLQGTVLIEMRKTGSIATNAQLQVNGGLTYGGSLEILDHTIAPLTAGDRFPLFNASSYSGAFSSLNLPLLPFGLVWTNKLLIDGSIEVTTSAADRFWTNSLGGNYQVAGNWLDSLGPGVADNADFTNNATYQVTWTADASAANAFFNASSGIVTQAIGAQSWFLTNNYVIGQNAGSTASVTHASGTLHVANSAGTALLDVRRGTYRFNAGLMDVDQLLMTNTAGVFEFNGGTLVTRGGVIANNTTFDLGANGSTRAFWDVRAGNKTTTSSSVLVGLNVAGCQLLLTNGGSLSSAAAFLGFNSTSTSNSVFVANANSVLRIGGFLGVGNSGGGNELRISNGGLVTNASVNIGFNSSASNNLVRVTDAGSTWITAGLLVGFQGVGNQVIVENGAHLVGTGTAQLGSGAFGNSNSVLVTGSGSLWTNTGTIIVGVNSAANTLIVSNAGTIYGSALTIGSASSSTNNRCVVNGATLRVTNANSTATIDIRRGTNQFNSGLIEADQLLVTNTLGFFEFNGGTLNVRTSIVANAQTFFAGDGTNAATLNLLGTGAHSFTNGLTIRSNALFTGNGTINATLTAQSGGVVFPSAGPSAPGALFLKGNLSLQSNSVFRVVLNGTSPGSGYSQLTLTNGNLTLGLNSPTLELVTSFTPAIGDSFIILQNQTFFGRSGDFKGLPEGTTFTNSGFLFQISYQGGSGNDVTVTRVAPPPPPLPAIPISAGSYAQDFNTLSGDGFSSNPWSNATTLPGWYASQSASPFDIGNYHSNNGGDTTGALYSYGAASSGERALGSLSSGTVGTIGFGLCFTNDTGHAVSNCTVSYTGEQWRCGGNGSVTNTLTFWYRVSPSVITDPDPASNTGWTAVTGLNFVSPTVLTNAGALDGNQPTNQHSFVMVAVPGFSVPAGQNVFFRWLDINDTGFDQGIAVDNFSVAFVARALGFSALYSNPTNKFVQLTGQGDANTMYVIEAASNLNFPIFWQRLGSNLTDGTGFLQFTDTNAPQFQNRFYRALSP